MNNKKYIGIVLVVAVCVLALYSGISHSGVVGESHDLSVNGGSVFTYNLDSAFYAGNNEQVCVFCHTPHGANRAVTNNVAFANGVSVNGSAIVNSSLLTGTQAQREIGPNSGSGKPMYLWNRKLPDFTVFSPYSSPTMNVNVNEVRIFSLMCLSCHDGVSAMNVLLNYPGDTSQPLETAPTEGGPGYSMGEIWDGTGGMWGPNIGDRTSTSSKLDLGNDHPISFDYTTTHPDIGGGLRNPDNTAGYVTNAAVRLFPNPRDGQLTSMECSTCHDVHNQGGGSGDPLYPFLVMSKVNSALCTNCHIK